MIYRSNIFEGLSFGYLGYFEGLGGVIFISLFRGLVMRSSGPC